MAIFLAIVVFSVIIIVHELGHFLAARAVGIEVEEFSLGFGPRLLSLGGKTKFSLRLVPLGGFVRMLGEEDGSGGDNPASYPNKTPWQRIAVTAAGPLMNFLLAMLIFIVLYSAVGLAPDTAAVVGQVVPGSPAEAAGLQAGDEVLSIDTQPIAKWSEIQDYVRSQGEKAMLFTFRRGDRIESLEITPRQGQQYPEVGIAPRAKRLSVWASIAEGVKETGRMTLAVFNSLVGIVTRKIPVEDITGPIGIVYYVGQAARAGWLNVLSLAALISVNLGLFNLLPIPALDGSKMALALVELIRRKRLDPNKEGIIHLVGFALLLVLMLVIMYRDFLRFIL